MALTSDQAETLLAAYQAGTPLKDLRTQFHVSQRTIYRHIQRAGIARRPRRRLSPEDVAEAAELYAGGATLKQLGARYGLDDETVRVRLVEAGVQLRRRGSRPRADEP